MLKNLKEAFGAWWWAMTDPEGDRLLGILIAIAYLLLAISVPLIISREFLS